MLEIKVDASDLLRAIKDLTALEGVLNAKADELVRRLAEIGVDVADREYHLAPYAGENDVRVFYDQENGKAPQRYERLETQSYLSSSVPESLTRKTGEREKHLSTAKVSCFTVSTEIIRETAYSDGLTKAICLRILRREPDHRIRVVTVTFTHTVKVRTRQCITHEKKLLRKSKR